MSTESDQDRRLINTRGKTTIQLRWNQEYEKKFASEREVESSRKEDSLCQGTKDLGVFKYYI